MPGSVTLLEARAISKAFSGIRVLDAVNLDVRRGEVHALVGENGAGKATFMNMLSGVLRPDAGEIYWDGAHARADGPRDAQALGISVGHHDWTPTPQSSGD